MRSAAGIAALLVLPALCFAQEDKPVPRPDVKLGDRWTYQRMDYDANKALGQPYHIRVVFAERGVIQMVSVRKGDEVDTTYTHEWNAVTVPGRVFNPHTGWFKFPLQVGATYTAAFETIVLKKDATSRNERRVRVVGWEEVVVPAGKFRALKIVSEGQFRRIDNTTLSGTARNVIWYVPEVKRWVKSTFENESPRKGRLEYSGEELVAFEVQ